MGAVVGAALAAGRSAEDLAQDLVTVRRRDVAGLNPAVLFGSVRARSVLRAGPLRHTIARLVPARRFDELVIPFTCTTTDMDTGEQVLFGSLGEDAPLIDALYASSALPVYYPSTVIGHRRLGDGGIRGVLPLDVAMMIESELVVAIDVGPGFDERHEPPPKGIPALLRAHGDATGILMAAASEDALARWRARPDLPRLIYVRPPVERGVTFEVDRLLDYVERGYAATLRELRAD
jgi:NTE family protein